MRIFLARMDETGQEKRDREKTFGRHLLASAIERIYGITFGAEDVSIDDNGKPYFSLSFLERLRMHTKGSVEVCYFNISHSGSYVVCAVSESNVGCDIQKLRKVPKNLYSVLALVNDAETEVENLMPEEQILLWTRYESLAKYIGCGIPINEDVLEQYRNACAFYSCLTEDYVITVCGKDVDVDCAVERIVLPKTQ